LLSTSNKINYFMKNIILFTMLFLSPTIMLGQKTTKVRDKKTNEVYRVIRSDNTAKHGEYKKYSFHNKLLIKGYYKFGQKDSIWECYDLEGHLTLVYDFSKDSLIFTKRPNAKSSTKYRIINADSPDDTLTRLPLFLGGEDFVTDELIKNLRYPDSAREAGKMGRVYVAFTVDKFGKTSNFHSLNLLGYGLDEEALRVFRLLPDMWLPGLVNGKPVDVEVVHPVTFMLE
ncbi:MAG: energy transducer TonB, partial [Chitinophagaceae bacterium]